MQETRLVAGAMSGTSADGVDVAIVRVEGIGYDMSPCLVLHHHRPYPAELRRAVFELRSGRPVGLGEFAGLGQEIALVHATAVNEALVAARLSANDLACVAVHGQTLYHAPPLTIQWLDPATLAAEVGCRVVHDFRRADCAVGGQGAPLVPFADYILFRHEKRNRVLVNIGGIANLTYLPAGGELSRVIAFDTGPGNCVSDYLMRQFRPGGEGYDEGGHLAMHGHALDPIVHRMLGDGYFHQPPPKSTDIPSMIAAFRGAVEGNMGGLHLEDVLATACRATARSLAEAMVHFLPVWPDEVIVSGGGVRNAALMRELQHELRGAALMRTEDLGVSGPAKEAIAFALLGLATLDEVPANVPAATGARRRVVLGAVTPRP